MVAVALLRKAACTASCFSLWFKFSIKEWLSSASDAQFIFFSRKWGNVKRLYTEGSPSKHPRTARPKLKQPVRFCVTYKMRWEQEEILFLVMVFIFFCFVFVFIFSTPCQRINMQVLKQGGPPFTADSGSCNFWLSCRMAGNRIKKKSKWTTFPPGARNTIPASRQTQQTPALIGGCLGTKGNWYLKKNLLKANSADGFFLGSKRGGWGREVGVGEGCRDNPTATRIQMTEKWQRWVKKADLSPQNFTKGNYTMCWWSGLSRWSHPTCSCCWPQPRLGALSKAGEERA